VRWGLVSGKFNSVTDMAFANPCPNETKDLDKIEVATLEMEALTAVQVALLTIYDMCKAVGRGMVMGDVKLLGEERW